jgi:phage tail P2-like protein
VDLSDVSIIPLLPPNLADDKNVRMMCQAFDSELRRLIANIPGIEIIPYIVRKQITDNLLLDLLAWQLHCDFYSTDFSIKQKQEIILNSLDWHTRKGTPSVIEEIVSTVFSRAEVKEWFDYDGLPYRFIIGTEEDIPDAETRSNLIRAINSVKNTRSSLDKIISIIYHEDELHATDSLEMLMHVNNLDEHFKHPIKFNGAAKFDGHTQNKHVYINGKFDGKYKFNGELPFGGYRKFNGDYKFDGKITFAGASYGKTRNPYSLMPPFKFSSCIVDTLDFVIRDIDFEDMQRAPLQFDGSVKFDGGSKFNGVSPYPMNTPVASTKDIKFDGGIAFDGKYQFSKTYGNKIGIEFSGNALSDRMNEGIDDVSMDIYRHHVFNGAYRFDGSIKFDGVPSIVE